MVAFSVSGTPAPQGSHRAFVVNGRAVVTNDSKATKPWRKAVSAAAVEAMAGGEPMDVAVEVVITFHLVRPASVSVKKRPLPSVRPDVDKYARSTLDGLTGIVYRDDSLVTDLRVVKRYADFPGAIIMVRPVDLTAIA